MLRSRFDIRGHLRGKPLRHVAICGLLALALALTFGRGGLAEPSGGAPPPLSLAQARSIAAANSNLLRMVAAQLEQAVLKDEEARRSADQVSPDDISSYELAQIKYLQPERAAADRRLAEAKLEGTRANLDLHVSTAYAGVLSAERFLGLAMTAAERAREQVQLTRQLEAAGLVARKDVLDALAREAEISANLASARRGAELARLGLLRLLGDGRTQLPRLDPSSLPAEVQDRDASSWAELALANRYESKQVDEYVRLAERNVELARQYPSGGFPVTSLPDIPGLPPGLIVEPSWERSNRYAIPLAEAQRDEAVYGRLLQREELVFQAKSAYLDYLEARERALLLGPAVDAAHEGYRLAGLRYEVGLATNLEVLAAELALRQAEANQAHAWHQLHLAVAKLISATGPGYRSQGG